MKLQAMRLDPTRLDMRSYAEEVSALLETELNRLPSLQGFRLERQATIDGFDLVIRKSPKEADASLLRMDTRGVISLTSAAQELLKPEDIKQLTDKLRTELPRINGRLVQQAIKAGMVTWVPR